MQTTKKITQEEKDDQNTLEFWLKVKNTLLSDGYRILESGDGFIKAQRWLHGQKTNVMTVKDSNVNMYYCVGFFEIQTLDGIALIHGEEINYKYPICSREYNGISYENFFEMFYGLLQTNNWCHKFEVILPGKAS